MKRKRMPKGYWTEQNIQNRANKYTRRGDFAKHDLAAYKAAGKISKTFLNKVCAHMDPPMTAAYTDQEIQMEANKYKKRSKFRKGNSNIYGAACDRGKSFLDKVCAHMEESQTEAYTEKEIQMEANKYKKRSKFAEGNSGAYQAAQDKGKAFLDKICAHMDPSQTEAYTDEELEMEALKHKRRVDFESANAGAYTVACDRGKTFLDKICDHMEPSLTEAYTEEEVRMEGLKYGSYTEFRKANNGACKAAERMGILDEVRSHMVQLKGTSAPEKFILSVVKEIYPSAKKIKDMTVCILDKPYIHGFDIDVFVPELMKGIEFDGDWYHSFEYMRKSYKKRLWSDDDIRNYHGLKDDWFATKDIQILHIKEEDWEIDKEDCIKRCLEFLAS